MAALFGIFYGTGTVVPRTYKVMRDCTINESALYISYIYHYMNCSMQIKDFSFELLSLSYDLCISHFQRVTTTHSMQRVT
jgi:hypothetical protein